MATKGTILYIEDEEDILMMYRVKFKSVGYTFLGALKGKEGLQIAKKEHPDVILLDIKLPDMDGLDVLKALKADPKTKKIPVVVFSNAYQREYEDKSLHLGAEDFILKTKTMPEEMIGVMKVYLDKAQMKQGKK